MVTVYIDVLFAVNFFINILIIAGGGIALSQELCVWRVVLSAGVGAVFACGMFFPNLGFVTSVWMKGIISVLMVLCAYRIKSVAHFLKAVAGFYVSSFIFGGGIIALMLMSDLGAKTGAVYSNGTVYFNLPWKMFFLWAAITFGLICFWGRIRKRKIQKKELERNLKICAKGRECEMKALADTGNLLFEPITGEAVIVCEYERVKRLLSCRKETLAESVVASGMRVRLVPFSSVGKKDGLMVGFCPDRVEVDGREAKKCVVGISETKLFENDEYHAVLNPYIIN